LICYGEEMIKNKKVILAISSGAAFLLVSALTITGCMAPNAGLAPTSPYYGGAYETPPPPQYSYGAPWVGTGTPWVFYQGDWFYNGMLYYFFGPQYGWAPYYAYPTTYIVRTTYWYEPRWNTWYHQHPQYVQTFSQRYPYWREHHVGQRYDQNFYNRYHQGQGGGWQKGYHAGMNERAYPEGRKPAQTQMPQGHGPGSYPMTPPSQAYAPERQKPVPGQGTYPEARGTGPYQKPRPASAQQQQQYQREQQYQQHQKAQHLPPQEQQRQTKHASQQQQSQQQHQEKQKEQHQQQQEKKAAQQQGQP
jgi:hypothetical protein